MKHISIFSTTWLPGRKLAKFAAVLGLMVASTSAQAFETHGAAAGIRTTLELRGVAAAPTITSFTPTFGPGGTAITGTLVTVTGTDFTGATAVKLNGTAISPFTVVDAQTITFRVLTTGTNGPISVTTPDGTATSTASFFLTPVISLLAPVAQVAGGADVNLTITGTNFTAGSTVNFNAVSYPATASTANSVTTTIPASAVATAGSYMVSVTSTGGTSGTLTFVVSNPSTAGAYENFETGTKASYTNTTGTDDVTLTSGSWKLNNALLGSTFADRFNGLQSARIRGGGFIAMNFDKPTGAGIVTVNAGLYNIDTGASFILEISTNGGTTYTTVTGAPATLNPRIEAYTFTVNQAGNVRFRVSSTNTVAGQNPRISIDDISVTNFTTAPTIASFTPTSAAAGTTVTVTGTDLTGATALTLNGAAITGFAVVNATTITFTVPAGATSGPIAITTPGGTATSTGTFTVIPDNPVPTITSIAPATAVAGAAALTLTVTGTNFISGSVVNFNGTALTTTFVSTTQLTAAVPASALAMAGTYNVTVTNAAPGGGTSANAAFTVMVPAPTIVSFTPTSGLAGATVTLTGTDFTGATAVTLNGLAITGFTIVDAQTITFAVPASATSGVIAVTTPTGTATSTATFTVLVPNPIATITSLAPNTAVAGAAALTLTVNGTNFLAASIVNFNGAALATTFVSATQLTAPVPATALATAGAFDVTVTNPAPGGGTSAAAVFTVTAPVVIPAPTIASFTPASALPGTVVTLTGTDFTGATALTLNGVAITGFTVVSATSITFTVPAGATSGTIAVTTPSGTATSATAFTVLVPNPVPAITSLAPATAVAGAAALTLTVNGTNFISGSVVNFNGAALATTFVSATQLTAPVPATALATAGAFDVTVTNPAPGGGTSTAAVFTVTAPVVIPAPTIASFTPTNGLAGATVTLTGTDFTGATAVTLNGAAITGFTVVNATTITFTVPAGATSGPIAVTTPGGTATSTTAFTVTVPNPAPAITGIAPATAVAGSAGFTLTVNGTGFLNGSVVNFNGTALTTTFVSATQLTAAVPASAVASAGSFQVTVTNAAPGGGTSAGVAFVVTAAAPTIASFTPTSGGPSTAITITGTNFTGATAVTIGTFAVASFTVVSATSITAVLPTGSGSVSGFITVVTPAGSATSSTTFNLVSATLAGKALPGLSVYPNPFQDRLTVSLPQAGAATVALRDLTGRVVVPMAPLAADKQLQLPATLAAGIYLLEVRQGDVTALRRVEKK